jgi:peroxiredoxin
MRKINSIIAAMVLATGLITSCQTETTPSEKEAHHEKHKDGKKGHHKGHDGHKGPKGKKGSPIQTKTIEEIGGYNIGDVATDFQLKDVNGSMVSLAGIKNAKGYIVTFTCNGCPFSVMYEDRLIELHNKYAPLGYSVIAINPNSNVNEAENYAAMQTRAKEKGFTFPYLLDEGQKIFPQYGAVRTPHVFVLDQDRKVQYIGAIDDNAKSAVDVKIKYIENAIEALEKGEKPSPNLTKAIGCPVKVMEK